jgi:hypothetical protein
MVSVSPAGAWQVRLLPSLVGSVQARSPMVMVAVALLSLSTRLVPVMVTGPPSRSPLRGSTSVMSGSGR